MKRAVIVAGTVITVLAACFLALWDAIRNAPVMPPHYDDDSDLT